MILAKLVTGFQKSPFLASVTIRCGLPGQHKLIEVCDLTYNLLEFVQLSCCVSHLVIVHRNLCFLQLVY